MSTTANLVAVIIAALVWRYLFRIAKFFAAQRHLYNALKPIPGPEMWLPLFGNINLLLRIARHSKTTDISKEFHDLLIRLCDQYGDKMHGLIRLWLGPFLPIIVICDAKTAQTVLNSPYYVDKASFYGIIRSAIGDGIFTCNSAKLKLQKKNLREHFKIRALEQYIENADRHLKVFTERVESCIDQCEGRFPDVKALVSPFVLDTLGENLFSTEFNSQQVGEPKFIQLVHKMLEIGYNAFLHPWTYSIKNILLRYLVNFSVIKNAFGTIMHFKKSTLKIVKDRYEKILLQQQKQQLFHAEHETKENISSISINNNESQNVSLLDSMILSRMQQSRLTKVNEINRQINTFVIAGHDTTTSSITWTLYLLAHHPEAQQRLRDEIDTFLDDLRCAGEPISSTNLKKLKYLDCCIKESLRLYPSGPFIGRRGRQPVKINDDVTLPADINVLIYIQYMQTSERYFAQADRFIPERFMKAPDAVDERSGRPWVTNCAMMPFSSGLRVCPGKEYGVVQQKLFLINALRRYTISVPEKVFGATQPKRFFLLSPAQYPIDFARRSTTTTTN